MTVAAAIEAGLLLWAYLVTVCLGVGALAVALAYGLGYALARAVESLRALGVPLLACTTHKRNALLSRPKAGRTALPSASRGAPPVSRTGHHSPALEPTPRLEPTLGPTSATSSPWLNAEDVAAASFAELDADLARRLWLNEWTADR